MTLDIPPGEFAAYIFDCDGTLADTMPLHYQAWLAAVRPAGLRISRRSCFIRWAACPRRG